jgi:amino acid transporter
MVRCRLTGYDAVSHCIEELNNPVVDGPRIMIACVLIGVVTGFVYLSVLLFVSKNLDNVISSAAGPMLQIFYDATNNKAGSICLLMFPLVCLLVSHTPPGAWPKLTCPHSSPGFPL